MPHVAKLRIVLDCNVYLQAYLSSKGSAERILKLADSDLVEIFTSREVIEELNDVLARPEFVEKFSHLSAESVESFLKRLNAAAKYIRKVDSHFEFRRDPKDARYINLAIQIDADFIVTWDKDLLDLMTGIDDESKQFRRKHQPLRIVEPTEFLSIVGTGDLHLNP